MNHPLLVARRMERQQIAILVKRLPHAGHIAPAEDPVAACDQPLAPAVVLGLLHGEKTDESLRDGQAHRRAHVRISPVLGATCSP